MKDQDLYDNGCMEGKDVAEFLFGSGIDIERFGLIPVGMPVDSCIGFMMGVQSKIAERKAGSAVSIPGKNDKQKIAAATFDPMQIIGRYKIGREM